MPDKNITFEIREHLGVIAHYDSGWSKELNVISWNGAAPKFDVRDWDEHHERMSRGLTLYPGEMRKLVDLYVTRNNNNAVARGRALESERKARRDAARKQREEQSALDEAEAAALEGAMLSEPASEVEPKEEEPMDTLVDVEFASADADSSKDSF